MTLRIKTAEELIDRELEAIAEYNRLTNVAASFSQTEPHRPVEE